ncbi:MAG TPA: hypothetical protein VJT75_17045 [Thermoleophilaceae bacterium]|nr:hypothetical protein [Thermoleophilaceae bacterium]
MTRCSLLGHRFRFTSEGAKLRWVCARGCGAGGEKCYPTAQDAARYARAFDREDRQQLGRNAPLFGLLPLRILHALAT